MRLLIKPPFPCHLRCTALFDCSDYFCKNKYWWAKCYPNQLVQMREYSTIIHFPYALLPRQRNSFAKYLCTNTHLFTIQMIFERSNITDWQSTENYFFSVRESSIWFLTSVKKLCQWGDIWLTLNFDLNFANSTAAIMSLKYLNIPLLLKCMCSLHIQNCYIHWAITTSVAITNMCTWAIWVVAYLISLCDI